MSCSIRAGSPRGFGFRLLGTVKPSRPLVWTIGTPTLRDVLAAAKAAGGVSGGQAPSKKE